MTPISVLIVTSTSSKKEATKIIRELLVQRLIACAQIFGPVSSLYRWESKVVRSTEYTLICKTLSVATKKVVAVVEELHSYECPVIDVIPCTTANASGRRWLKESIL
jgi:periplasmic divalent cation tolerance protein